MKSNGETSTMKQTPAEDVWRRQASWLPNLPDSDGRIPLVQLQLRGLRHTMSKRSTNSAPTLPLEIFREAEESPITSNTTARTKLTREAKNARLRAILEEALRVEHDLGLDDFGLHDN
eukprot:scaffold1221_cov207-Amphora_coffeaeformis.AAC.35